MPLIIGDIKANITVTPPADASTEPTLGPVDVRDDEMARLRRIAQERFDAERRIVQRDPDLLGGR